MPRRASNATTRCGALATHCAEVSKNAAEECSRNGRVSLYINSGYVEMSRSHAYHSQNSCAFLSHLGHRRGHRLRWLGAGWSELSRCRSNRWRDHAQAVRVEVYLVDSCDDVTLGTRPVPAVASTYVRRDKVGALG